MRVHLPEEILRESEV